MVRIFIKGGVWSNTEVSDTYYCIYKDHQIYYCS